MSAFEKNPSEGGGSRHLCSSDQCFAAGQIGKRCRADRKGVERDTVQDQGSERNGAE